MNHPHRGDRGIEAVMSTVVGVLAMLAIINAALGQLREWLRVHPGGH